MNSNVSNYFSFNKDNCVLANSLQGEAASGRRAKITLLLFIKKETCFTELCQCFKKLYHSDLITDKCPEKINCMIAAFVILLIKCF